MGDLQCSHFGESRSRNEKYSFKGKHYNYISSISVVVIVVVVGGGE
jgi:hypothetical protein